MAREVGRGPKSGRMGRTRLSNIPLGLRPSREGEKRLGEKRPSMNKGKIGIGEERGLTVGTRRSR
jgi:hypothetical protein